MFLYGPFDDDKPTALEAWLGNKARKAFYKTLAAAGIYPVSTLIAPLRQAIDADDTKAITEIVKKNRRALRGDLGVLLHAPLVYALVNEKYAAAETMLAAEPGLIADQDYFGATPLVQMPSPLHEDDEKVMRAIDFLLKHGASLEERDREASGVLAAAVDRPESKVAAFLLDRGAALESKDKQGFTPLLRAASSYEHEAAAKLLVERGADLQAQTRHGYTPATLAARAGNEKLARYLVAQGGAINFGAKDMEDFLTSPDPAWSPEFISLLTKQKSEWDDLQRDANGTEAAEEMSEGLKAPMTVSHRLHLKRQGGTKGFPFK